MDQVGEEAVFTEYVNASEMVWDYCTAGSTYYVYADVAVPRFIDLSDGEGTGARFSQAMQAGKYYKLTCTQEYFKIDYISAEFTVEEQTTPTWTLRGRLSEFARWKDGCGQTVPLTQSDGSTDNVDGIHYDIEFYAFADMPDKSIVYIYNDLKFALPPIGDMYQEILIPAATGTTDTMPFTKMSAPMEPGKWYKLTYSKKGDEYGDFEKSFQVEEMEDFTMATLKNKPMPSIGVDRYTYFPVTTVDGADSYGAAVQLPGTVEIAPTDSGSTAVFEADNCIYTSVSDVQSMGHTITNADIPPAVDAEWRGLAVDDGMMTMSTEAKTPKFAVAWRVMKADGSYRYVRYYKGSYSFASNVGGVTKKMSGDTEFKTAEATYTAEAAENGEYYSYIDENDLPTGVTKATLEEKWFTDPTWMPKAGA